MNKRGNTEKTDGAVTNSIYMNSASKYVKPSIPQSLLPSPRNIPIANTSPHSLPSPSHPSRDVDLTNPIFQAITTQHSRVNIDKNMPVRDSPDDKEQQQRKNSMEEQAMQMSANIFMHSTTKFVKGFADLSNYDEISPNNDKDKKPTSNVDQQISAGHTRKSLIKREVGPSPKRPQTPEKAEEQNPIAKLLGQISASSQISIETNPLLNKGKSTNEDNPMEGALHQLVSTIKSPINSESKIKINVHTFTRGKADDKPANLAKDNEIQDRSRSNSQEGDKRKIERKNVKTRELKFGEKKDEKSATSSKLEIDLPEAPTNQTNINPSKQSIPSVKSLDAKSPFSRTNNAQKPVENRISDARSADARQIYQRKVESKEEHKEEHKEDHKEDGEKVAPFSRHSQQNARKPLLRKTAANQKEVAKEEKPIVEQQSLKAVGGNKEERAGSPSPRKNSPGLQGCKKQDARQIASMQTDDPTPTISKTTNRNVNNKLPTISTIKEEKSEEPQLSTKTTYPKKHQQELIKESEIKPNIQPNTINPNSAGFDRLWQNNNAANARIVREFDQKNSQLNKESAKIIEKPAKSPAKDDKPVTPITRKAPLKQVSPVEEKEEPKRKIIERKQEAAQPKRELVHTQPIATAKSTIQSPPNNQLSPAITQKLSPTPYQLSQNNAALSPATTSVVSSVKSQLNTPNTVIANQPKARTINEKKAASPPKQAEVSPKKEAPPKIQSVLSVTPFSPPTKEKIAVSPRIQPNREANYNAPYAQPSRIQQNHVKEVRANNKDLQDAKDGRDTKPSNNPKESIIVLTDKKTQTTDISSRRQSFCSESKLAFSKLEQTAKTAITRTDSLCPKRSSALPLAYIKFIVSKILLTFNLIKSKANFSNKHQKELIILAHTSQDLANTCKKSHLRSGFDQIRRNWASSHLQKKNSRVRDNQRDITVGTLLQSLVSSRLRSTLSTIKDQFWLEKHNDLRQKSTKLSSKKSIESTSIQKSASERAFYINLLIRISNTSNQQISRTAFYKILLQSISNSKKPINLSASIIQSKSNGKLVKQPRDYESQKQVLYSSNGELQSEVSSLDSRINEKRKYQEIEKGRLIRKLDENSKKNKVREAEYVERRAVQKELKAVIDQLPPLQQADLELPEGEPLVGLLTEIYAEVFALPTETVCIGELMSKYSLHKEDHNPLLEEWEVLRRNAELRRAVGQWEGTDAREERARGQLTGERDVVRSLMANYARERYLWEYVHAVSQTI